MLQLVDKAVRIHIPASLHDFFVGDALLPQEDVGPNRSGEQKHILEHLAEMTAQGGNLDLLDVHAVN